MSTVHRNGFNRTRISSPAESEGVATLAVSRQSREPEHGKGSAMDQHAFGAFIRQRRDAIQPEDVGLHRGQRRRTSGLRREEVAAISGMSPDYLSRLERGDGPQPSAQIVHALARGLRLSVAERDHLLLLAGHTPPTVSEADDLVSPGLLRILDSLTTTPAQVMGALGETLAQNATAVALFGDEARFTGPARSAPYRWFTDPSARVLYPPEDHEHQSRVMVSQLQHTAAQASPASRAAALVTELRHRSPEFADLWHEQQIGLRNSEEKRFLHPEVGLLALHCQTSLDTDRRQTLLVFTATPSSPDAERLRLLSVVGTYNLHGD